MLFTEVIDIVFDHFFEHIINIFRVPVFGIPQALQWQFHAVAGGAQAL